MKIGSHNTMSYLAPKNKWLRPFHFTARCQSKTFQQQISAGATMFDLRIIFKKDGTPAFAHGLMEFECPDFWYVFDSLDQMSHIADVRGEGKYYVRIINERDENFVLFKEFCEKIENTYVNLKFFGGRNKKDWSVLYNFKEKQPDMIDKYSSCNYDIKGKCTGWIIDDLWPRIYAMCFNKMWRRKFSDYDGWLFQDFVGIY